MGTRVSFIISRSPIRYMNERGNRLPNNSLYRRQCNMGTSLIDTVLTTENVFRLHIDILLKRRGAPPALRQLYGRPPAATSLRRRPPRRGRRGAHATRCTRPMARALPRGTQRTHSTPSRDDGVDFGVERRYLPHSALRVSLGRLKRSRAVGRRKPMAPKGAWQEAVPARSNACDARAGLGSAPRCALRASLGRL